MGLFDFAKDMGKKLFDSAEEASDKLRAKLGGGNPGIADLDVKFDDGVVSLEVKHNLLKPWKNGYLSLVIPKVLQK